MIHVSCDRCGRLIDPRQDLRYVVEMDIRAKMDASELGCEDDSDPLQSLDQILEAADSLASELIDERICRLLKFDLCEDCHRRFMKNPIGVERLADFAFSKN